jgi:hypothetical protein
MNYLKRVIILATAYMVIGIIGESRKPSIINILSMKRASL